MITLRSGQATATIDPYGGQVMSYLPGGMADVLWRTTDDHLDAARRGGKALRGGIPVCWPWFGPHPADKSAPTHGLARVRTWQVVASGPDRATLALALDGSDTTFPQAAEGRIEVVLGEALEVRLTTTNRSPAPFRLTQGLHTYLRVGDIGTVEVRGLDGATSQNGDRADGPLAFAGEVDRIYHPVAGPLDVVDRALRRTIRVTNGGCSEAVVWNPWSDKADMPAGGFRQMLCVEPANARQAPTLQPGETATISTRLAATPL